MEMLLHGNALMALAAAVLWVVGTSREAWVSNTPAARWGQRFG